MREIKFRAWTGEGIADLYKVTPFALTQGVGDGLFLPFDKKYVLMQFTGFLDKNGTEIYEGDIVSLKRGGDQQDKPELVEWNNCGWLPWMQGAEDSYYTASDLAVIGNVHENPELLK